MHFNVSKHAVDRYLQRVEGASFSESRFHVNRVRARLQIREDLRGVEIPVRTEQTAVHLPRYIAIVRNGSVVTILKPGMDDYLPSVTVHHQPAEAAV